MMGQTPQQCFLMPLLPGTDGVQKMSKSLGNYIGIDEPANEIYGKAMSLPDDQIVPYSEYLTDIAEDEIDEMRQALGGSSVNPMELKKRLARELVAQFHDANAAREAEGHFERTVQGRELPEDIAEFALPPSEALADMRLSRLLVDAGLANSAGEARRLIDQGAVQIDGERVNEDSAGGVTPGSVLRAGRRRYVRLV
jgi:tyrosyl-tRNA synthetase